ncbi:hypothetical protein BDV36DRAFT_259751 [Aspergillus pseudocaelatus]|uniref:Uncharacterized protein n=1 Tax=Aspergillus pseudocaelatus TaxID=1825620 RepID=A0ABQ6WHA9_9EURO|nr:hypothetical protein BDV36DRAFT_259751 [Aspergillus pseudocaelatus]
MLTSISHNVYLDLRHYSKPTNSSPANTPSIAIHQPPNTTLNIIISPLQSPTIPYSNTKITPITPQTAKPTRSKLPALTPKTTCF